MNFCRSFFLSLPLSLFILSCSSADNSGETVEMEFNVDSTLVDKLVEDSGLTIHYRVPGSWKELQASDSAIRQLSSTNIKVHKILQNPTGNVVFSLTDVRGVPDSVLSSMDVNYKTTLNPAGSWSNVERAEFVTGGFKVRQYVMSRPRQTFFKMFFGERNRPSFQVDYSIIVDSAYALNTKTLESIIGSLKRDH